MQVEVRSDRRTHSDTADVAAEVEAVLARYQGRITRVEVFLSDVNGPKGGDDHRCVVEARVAHRHPVAVTHEAGSSEDALSGALDKMDRLLDSTFDRLNDVKGNTSASGLPT